MKKVNLIGGIFDSSGFSSHIRQLANSMHEQGIQVRLDCQKPYGWERNVNDAELLMLNREFTEDMTSILVGFPQFLPLVWAENPKETIMFLIFEGDKIPEYWLEYLYDERTSQIWVPSQHVKNAILNTCTNIDWQPNLDIELLNKIHIVPHGVNNILFKPEEKKKDKPFTFLINKGWRGGMDDRGGVQYALKAFDEEFKDDDVKLILKINPAYNSPDWNIEQELINLGISKSNKILINTQFIDYKQLPAFYADADVYINACRAEGFGLPGLEAHAMGLPTIQTNFGGQLDYMKKSTDYYIDYDLEEVTFDINYEGVQWATPKIDHLRKLMRHCYNNQDEVKKKGSRAKVDACKWGWCEAAKKVKRLLN